MIVAIILAGGRGVRMGNPVPKQFIEVRGKPILAYTLEGFQECPLIDAIEVVCLKGHEEEIKGIASHYRLSKVRRFAEGGASAQESIRNGVYALEGSLKDDDVAVIHDGIRPLVDQSVLEDVVRTSLAKGNGVTSLPYNEQIFLKSDDESATDFIPRDTLMRVQTPQAYRYGTLLRAYREAFSKGVGIGPTDYANTMMSSLGERLYFAKGSEYNIKLTNPVDLKIFEALLGLEGQSK